MKTAEDAEDAEGIRIEVKKTRSRERDLSLLKLVSKLIVQVWETTQGLKAAVLAAPSGTAKAVPFETYF